MVRSNLTSHGPRWLLRNNHCLFTETPVYPRPWKMPVTWRPPWSATRQGWSKSTIIVRHLGLTVTTCFLFTWFCMKFTFAFLCLEYQKIRRDQFSFFFENSCSPAASDAFVFTSTIFINFNGTSPWKPTTLPKFLYNGVSIVNDWHDIQ